jgi:hypothetical protein
MASQFKSQCVRYYEGEFVSVLHTANDGAVLVLYSERPPNPHQQIPPNVILENGSAL